MRRLLLVVGALLCVKPAMAHTGKHHHNHSRHSISKSIKHTRNTKSSITTQVGIASWYGKGFSGRKTASGERFNQYGLTAASKSLPLGTKVIVTNLNNGKQTILKINDRGPYVGHRIMDVSKGAAIRLGMIRDGKTRIKIKVLGNQLPEEVAEATK